MRITNLEQFIKVANKIHNNKYDYSLSTYVKCMDKIKIICPEHGIFIQSPNSHISNKRGCPICNGGIKYNKYDFIKKSIEIHGDKYDYSLVEYINSKTKVRIICPIHGVFEQMPKNHINGQICKKCDIFKKSLKTNDFIKRAIEIHGDKYDYSLVNYINMKSKVKLICPIHGVFEQKANDHINKKQGCKLCANKSLRLKTIKRIEDNKLNGYQLIPNFNKNACEIFNNIMKEQNIHIQHAMNGGEYYIKELGYWLDGYDKENNVAYEFDEKTS